MDAELTQLLDHHRIERLICEYCHACDRADEALMASAQTLALYSPDYIKDAAVYSRAERYATWWQDPGDDRRKLIPVLLHDTKLTPLTAPISGLAKFSGGRE